MRWLLLAAGPAAVLGLAALRSPTPTHAVSPRRPHRADAGPSAGAPEWLSALLASLELALDPRRTWLAVRWSAPAALIAIAVAVAPAAALLVGLGMVAAPPRLSRLVHRRLRQRCDAQLPASLERLASALRAGAALGPAFVEVATTAPDPLGEELRVVADEIEHGAGVGVALERWAVREGASPAVRLAAAALGLGVEAGGEVARSVDRVAATLRERRELQAEAHSLATQARASATVLGLAPIGFTALVSSIEPGVVHVLVASPTGWLCLGAGLALDAAGLTWMSRIMRRATCSDLLPPRWPAPQRC